MSGLGVIVECCPFSQVKETSKDKLSCSGIYLGNDWILSHGTIAVDLFKEKISEPLVVQLQKQGFALYESGSPLKIALDTTKYRFQVILDETNHKKVCKFKSLLSETKSCSKVSSKSLGLQDLSHLTRFQDRTFQLPLVSSPETPKYFCHHVEVCMLFTQPGITKTLATMMPASDGWKLMDDNGEKSSVDLETIILSSFVMLKVIDGEANNANSVLFEELEDLTEKFMIHAMNVNKGTLYCLCFLFIEMCSFWDSSSYILYCSSIVKIVINLSFFFFLYGNIEFVFLIVGP